MNTFRIDGPSQLRLATRSSQSGAQNNAGDGAARPASAGAAGHELMIHSDGGTLRAWSPARKAMCTVMRGRIGVSLMSELIHFASELSAEQGRLAVYHDWLGLDRYDRAARELLLRWYKDVPNTFGAIHILYAAPSLRVDLALCNVLVDGIIVGHRDVDSFQRARSTSIQLATGPRYH